MDSSFLHFGIGLRRCFFTERNGIVSAEIIKSIELEKAKAVEYPGNLWYTNGVLRETTIKEIASLVKPVTEKYGVKEIYLFGSYARGEADGDSDVDFLVFGGESFRLTMVFALAEELRVVLKKMWMFLKLVKLMRAVIFTIQL